MNATLSRQIDDFFRAVEQWNQHPPNRWRNSTRLPVHWIGSMLGGVYPPTLDEPLRYSREATARQLKHARPAGPYPRLVAAVDTVREFGLPCGPPAASSSAVALSPADFVTQLGSIWAECIRRLTTVDRERVAELVYSARDQKNNRTMETAEERD
ncbi:hypothetical protein SLS57_011847 [Botryosphaeria dothidea]